MGYQSLNRRYVILAASLVIALDQWTKWLVVRHFIPGASRDLIPGYLSLTYVQNSGGAFGILQHSTALLAAIALIALSAVGVYLGRNARHLNALTVFAIALPVGGAVGNLCDRVRLRYVVDFLDAHVGTHQWPVFNVADSSICIGVALLLLINWKSSSQASNVTPHSVKE